MAQQATTANHCLWAYKASFQCNLKDILLLEVENSNVLHLSWSLACLKNGTTCTTKTTLGDWQAPTSLKGTLLIRRFPHFTTVRAGEEPDEEVEVSCNNSTRPLLPVTRLHLFKTEGALCVCVRVCAYLHTYMSSDPLKQAKVLIPHWKNNVNVLP